jgi:hypothetical protein
MSDHLTRKGLQRCLIGGISLLIMTAAVIVGIARHFAV